MTAEYDRCAPAADLAWREHLREILLYGKPVSPRGQPTLEILQTKNIVVDMARPLITSPARKLYNRFAVAEALWILSGDNRLEPLQRFIKDYDRFSDDGQTLFGAYGPPVASQIDYVVKALVDDRETRQAALTIWRQNPPRSRDVPCTIAAVFSIRDDKLHAHFMMRSSDAWLGIPNDLLCFAMIGAKVACLYNRHNFAHPVRLGALCVSMTSAHLYLRDQEKAEAVLASPTAPSFEPVPERLVLKGAWDKIEDSLIAVREKLPLQDWMWKVIQ